MDMSKTFDFLQEGIEKARQTEAIASVLVDSDASQVSAIVSSLMPDQLKWVCYFLAVENKCMKEKIDEFKK